MGITKAGYSKFEKGKTSLSLDKLQQLALIMELPIENIINFDSQHYLNQSIIAEKATAANSHNNFELVIRLYEDKITLLEKLLGKTDRELQFYKERYAMP